MAQVEQDWRLQQTHSSHLCFAEASQKLLRVTILMDDVLVRHTCGSDGSGLRSVNCKGQTPDTSQAVEAGCGDSRVGLHSGAAEKVTPLPSLPLATYCCQECS